METRALALMPSGDEWQQMKDIAMMAVKSGLLPKAVDTPEKAVIIALKGRELGLPPMVAFSHINVIQGKPTMSAEIMLAYIYEKYPNAEINFIESTVEKCVLEAKRPSETKFTRFEWNLDRAKRMGLIGKDNWIKQPETMMRWRCVSEMKRLKFPEVLMGIDHTPEEIEDSLIREARIVTPNNEKPEAEQQEPKSLKKTVKNHAPQTSEEAKARNAEITQQGNTQQTTKTKRQQIAEEILAIGKQHGNEIIEAHAGGKALKDMSDDELSLLLTEIKENLRG